MATAEAAPSSGGPRYAPDDPTLPQPWKGLIDGSTGLLYYWNPETNVTQYEKPAGLPPPLPPGPPPAASTPSLAPIPGARTAQTTDVQSQQSHQQHVQHLNSSLQQEQQTTLQVAQQHSSQITPSSQPQSSFYVPAMQQQGQMATQPLRPQMMQYTGQQMPPQSHVQLQSGSQLPQQMPQQFDQQNQMYQSGPMGNAQTYSFPHQKTQYMPYQSSITPQGQQNSGQHTPQIMQGQQYPHQQDQKPGLQQREDAEPQKGKQVAFSPAPSQQNTSSIQNVPAVSNSIQSSHLVGQLNLATQYGGPSSNQQQQPPFLHQMPQGGADPVHPQQFPRFQNQSAPGSMHPQQPNTPPFRPNMGFEESPHGRSGNDYYYNSSKDSPVMAPQHPKLAAIPLPRNHQVCFLRCYFFILACLIIIWLYCCFTSVYQSVVD